MKLILKYGFCKKYFDRNEPLTSWTLLSPVFFQISADLEKNGGQKCSTGQRFIFTEVTFYKIHILKFVFSKKATKIDEIFTDYLTLTTLRSWIKGYTRLLFFRKKSSLPSLIWVYPFIKIWKKILPPRLFEPTRLSIFKEIPNSTIKQL